MRLILLTLALLLSFTVSAQLSGGAGLVTGSGDPNSITLLDIQDSRGESVLYYRTDDRTYYGYDSTLVSGSRWYLLAFTDDQNAGEVTVIQQNGVTGTNVQEDLEALWSAIAAGGDAWGNQVVISDNTLLGDGTNANSLKVDTTVIATQSDIAGLTNTTVSAGVGITVVQTGEDYEVTNAAPDQTVTISDGGNGNVTSGGTYPNLTIDVPDNLDNDGTNEAQILSASAPNSNASTITLGQTITSAGGGIVNITATGSNTLIGTANSLIVNGIDETENLTIDGTIDPTLNLTTVSGTLGAEGAVQVLGISGITVLSSGNDIRIASQDHATVVATSHTDAGLQSVAIDGWFISANPNEMGIPPGIKVQRAY